MTEVAVHKLFHLVGLDDAFHKYHQHASGNFLCDMMTTKKTLWEQFLETELQGVSRSDGLTVEIAIGQIRALIRMLFFDYERVAQKEGDMYAIALEIVKLVFVVSLMFTCNNVLSKVFQICTGGGGITVVSDYKGPVMTTYTDYEDAVLADGEFSPR